jgi:predicted patatin/cPLA2 family phospholipase
MHEVLMASSGVPPFMPVTLINGMPAFDGGLVDNVPVEPLKPVESAGGRTLVLLTRLYRHMPDAAGRTYVQPSRKIELSQFDITNPDGIRAAYELGLRDGNAFAASLGK